MAIREIVNYHPDGTITKETFDDGREVVIDLDAQITEQEQKLLEMYEELDRLKALRNS